MKQAVIALVDCNNFYASCEKVFEPAIQKKPVVILSNNDGCIIARSAEAKVLGIPMGAPYFKVKDELMEKGVVVRSSNYALYGDMSERVMKVLAQFSPQVERYSIDEAFLSLEHVPENELNAYLMMMRKTVQQWTGIPVSVGLAHSKTLAKIANHVAKKDSSLEGCCNFLTWSEAQLHVFLQQLPIKEVWGIGYGSVKKLQQCDIYTAYDFAKTSLTLARKVLSVLGERIVLELNGISCIPLEIMWKPRKGIMYTRGFGQDIATLTAMEEAITAYTMRAWQKLSRQNSQTSGLSIFIKTNRFGNKFPYRTLTQSISFPATCNITLLIKYALEITRKVWLPNLAYHKAGVILYGIRSSANEEMTLWGNISDSPKSLALMESLKRIQNRFGRETVRFANQTKKPAWEMRQAFKSPRYTTSLNELPQIY